METIIIKTVDGNRYEVGPAKEVTQTTIWGIPVLSFPVEDGMKFLNTQNIVSITLKIKEE